MLLRLDGRQCRSRIMALAAQTVEMRYLPRRCGAKLTPAHGTIKNGSFNRRGSTPNEPFWFVIRRGPGTRTWLQGCQEIIGGLVVFCLIW